MWMRMAIHINVRTNVNVSDCMYIYKPTIEFYLSFCKLSQTNIFDFVLQMTLRSLYDMADLFSCTFCSVQIEWLI